MHEPIVGEVTLSSSVDAHDLVDANGDNPASQTDRPLGVSLDSGSSGEDVRVVVAGPVNVFCDDTTVSKGDLVVPSGTAGGQVEADSATASEIPCGVALEGCDSSGEKIEIFFLNYPAN